MSYGLPTGADIAYGADGFPPWVYQLGATFGLSAATYPGHQESDRAGEPGFAPNPGRLNRGIDWSGPVEAMDRFATYCLSIREHLEQVIWQHPRSGRRVGVAGGRDVSATDYYAEDYPEHRDHVHTRQSQPLPLPAEEAAPMGWTGDPIWLAEVLRAYDRAPALKVRELPSWQRYGHGDMRQLWGVMVHHTGNAAETAESIQRGRPDLPGPLSNLHIAPDGTVTVVAAGVCWHAGMGSYPGIPTNMANQYLIGIECAWPRDTSITPATQTRERWPDAQMVAMRDTVAAVLTRLGVGAERVIGHKEWAGAAQGKWDPGNLSMDFFRGEVAKSMAGAFRPGTKPATAAPAPPKPPTNNPLAAMTDRQILEAIYRRIDGLAIKSGTP